MPWVATGQEIFSALRPSRRRPRPRWRANSELKLTFDLTVAQAGDFAGYNPDFKIQWLGSKSGKYNLVVRRAKARSSSGCESHPATVAPAGSNRSSRPGSEATEKLFGAEGHLVA